MLSNIFTKVNTKTFGPKCTYLEEVIEDIGHNGAYIQKLCGIFKKTPLQYEHTITDQNRVT